MGVHNAPDEKYDGSRLEEAAKRFWGETLCDTTNPAAIIAMRGCETVAINASHIAAFGNFRRDVSWASEYCEQIAAIVALNQEHCVFERLHRDLVAGSTASPTQGLQFLLDRQEAGRRRGSRSKTKRS